MSDRWQQELKQAGYKLTGPRRAVLRVLEKVEGHLSPLQILKQGRLHYRALSRATVYRTLELLRELGVVRPLYLGETYPQYTVAAGGHHHCVCSDCGQVIEFHDCVEEKLAQTIERRLGFKVKSHLLEFHGVCKKCR